MDLATLQHIPVCQHLAMCHKQCVRRHMIQDFAPNTEVFSGLPSGRSGFTLYALSCDAVIPVTAVLGRIFASELEEVFACLRS